MNQPEEKAKKTVVWLFGRGASVACNLEWTVPEEWKSKPRCDQVGMIKCVLASEMQKSGVKKNIYADLLGLLSTKTENGWKHLFVTTNWDYLRQQAIDNLCLLSLPPWLSSSHVFHLNGTIETCTHPSNRSPFLLETDPSEMRAKTVEANAAYNTMIWQGLFVVVGMSFDCEMDKSLLCAFNSVEDNMPIGESHWIIVNRNAQSLEAVSSHTCSTMPRSTVEKVAVSIEGWIAEGMPQLKCLGVLSG